MDEYVPFYLRDILEKKNERDWKPGRKKYMNGTAWNSAFVYCMKVWKYVSRLSMLSDMYMYDFLNKMFSNIFYKVNFLSEH